MKYIEWRDELEHFLGELDESERENIILYYGEMYADKRDEGLSEEEAKAQAEETEDIIRMTTTIEFTDFNGDVQIDVPEELLDGTADTLQ